MPTPWKDTRVTKKLSAAQPGALKLARRYGNALVCVRYRCDEEGQTRYTTVELLVEEAPILKRGRADADRVAVKVPPNEMLLRQSVQFSGGEWDAAARVWRLPRTTAMELGLLERVVAE